MPLAPILISMRRLTAWNMSSAVPLPLTYSICFTYLFVFLTSKDKCSLRVISLGIHLFWIPRTAARWAQPFLQTEFILHHRNMCPDLSAKTFHLFSNTVPLASYSVLIVIEKVKASTHIWCLPAELVVSPLISAEPDLCRLSFDCISVWAIRAPGWFCIEASRWWQRSRSSTVVW